MSNILCIDIGGTRIKVAILSDTSTIEELKNTNVKVMGTLGWMNSSLPKIINKTHLTSLTHPRQNLGHYDSISIGVPFKVTDNGSKVEGYYINECGVPSNLMEAFKEGSNCKITITNDSISWMRGALNYFQLFSKKISFPCLSIILGTGVGLAYSDSDINIKNIEASEQKPLFLQLSDISNANANKHSMIHDALGEKFFQDVKELHKNWDYLKIQNEYTKRVIALFKDIEKANLFNCKDVKSIIIGGGNSKYLNLSTLKSSLSKSIHSLSGDSLQINPDLIPLLGLSLSVQQ